MREKLPESWRNPTPRDPARIDQMLRLIGGVWKAYPDLRLGQLLLNAAGQETDLYYVEDDEMRERLLAYASVDLLPGPEPEKE